MTTEDKASRWRIVFIDPSLLEYNPFFHRENLEEPFDEAFVESATRDLMQAVIVRRKPGSKVRYQIAFGHRRAQAFKLKGLRVPCHVRSLSDEEMVDYAFTDAFQREDHSPRGETQLIVARLDMKLRHHPQYQKYARDPLVVLRAMEHQRTHRRKVEVGQEKLGERGRPATGKYPVPEVLCRTVERVFSELPQHRRMGWSTFVKDRIALLKIPADEQERADAKGIPGSPSMVCAIAKVRDPFARKHTFGWVEKRERRIPVRIMDKRVHVLNKCEEELKHLSSKPRLKRQLIDLVLEKCPHPADVQLEAERLLAGASKRSTAERNQEVSIGVYIGDSGDMSEIPDGSVRLIVASPPFFNKVEFDDDLSHCRTPDEFFEKIDANIRECARVMAPSGKLVINWGEPITDAQGEEYEEEILAHRWVDVCRKVGLKLWGKWIWWKDPPAYAIAQDRVQYEDAARGDGRIHLNWQWLLVFRKPNQAGSKEPLREVLLSHDDFVALSNGVWRIGAAREGPRGLAVFPEELVEGVIKYYSRPGDTVLDPFLGTGTTVLVARRLGRNGVGYEISRSLIPEIKRRLGIVPKEKASAI